MRSLTAQFALVSSDHKSTGCLEGESPAVGKKKKNFLAEEPAARKPQRGRSFSTEPAYGVCIRRRHSSGVCRARAPAAERFARRPDSVRSRVLVGLRGTHSALQLTRQGAHSGPLKCGVCGSRDPPKPPALYIVLRKATPGAATGLRFGGRLATSSGSLLLQKLQRCCAPEFSRAGTHLLELFPFSL